MARGSGPCPGAVDADFKPVALVFCSAQDGRDVGTRRVRGARPGMSFPMRWFWSFNRAYSVLAAVLCVVLFAAMLVAGQGLKSFLVLAAGAFWIVMARYDRERARAAHRHHALRRRRLERMRDGTWHGPHRDD